MVAVTPSSRFSSVVVAVTPSSTFSSAVVAVIPSSVFNSVVLAVIPSSVFSSAAVAVTTVLPSVNPLAETDRVVMSEILPPVIVTLSESCVEILPSPRLALAVLPDSVMKLVPLPMMIFPSVGVNPATSAS